MLVLLIKLLINSPTFISVSRHVGRHIRWGHQMESLSEWKNLRFCEIYLSQRYPFWSSMLGINKLYNLATMQILYISIIIIYIYSMGKLFGDRSVYPNTLIWWLFFLLRKDPLPNSFQVRHLCHIYTIPN